MFSKNIKKLLFDFFVKRWIENEPVSFEDFLQKLPRVSAQQIQKNYQQVLTSQQKLNNKEV